MHNIPDGVAAAADCLLLAAEDEAVVADCLLPAAEEEAAAADCLLPAAEGENRDDALLGEVAEEEVAGSECVMMIPVPRRQVKQQATSRLGPALQLHPSHFRKEEGRF
jgi:hypothetical protein